MLQKNPADRPQSGIEVIKALEACGFDLASQGTKEEPMPAPALLAADVADPTARPLSRPSVIERAPQRNRSAHWLIAGGVLCAAGAVVMFSYDIRAREKSAVIVQPEPPPVARVEPAPPPVEPVEPSPAAREEERPPAETPPQAVTPEKTEAPKRKLFEELDAKLKRELEKRGFKMASLPELSPELAADWAALRKAKSPPDREVRQTFDAILAELPADRLDKEHLLKRMQRVRAALQRTAEGERGASFEATQEAYVQLTLLAARATDKPALEAVAKELDRLEAELAQR
jgi:hypothetical protein